MRFHADLHVHSKYSRATSRDADLEHLAAWACRKGIAIVATGDFTHPAWLAELVEKLVPAEPGLFRLRPEIEQRVLRELPGTCRSAPRFLLSVEISTIYKKGDRTRKIHHLVYMPDFEAARRFVTRLARIGNLASDGRPILGLDSRHLLEIVLESSPDAYLIPAHIWTPWFAVLGSKSGFDSIVECYGDLAQHIFAVETGLSSDPPMNWRLSLLDRYRLVSSSDAHSPAKLGREVTVFDSDLDYFALRRALETGSGYVGTAEFFPEEGKYHLDGHRRCGVRLTPRETRAHAGRCPVCSQPATVGVLHRVEVLADRAEDDPTRPPTAGAVVNLIPLAELLGEIAGSGPGSKGVERRYDRLISALGPELSILSDVPLEEIARADSSLVAEAIRRLRAGVVHREAGYDGEYGTIRLFEPGELSERRSGGLLFELPAVVARVAEGVQPGPGATAALVGSGVSGVPGEAPSGLARAPVAPDEVASGRGEVPPFRGPSQLRAPAGLRAALDADQRAALDVVGRPLLIVAGPGSGKTRTLTYRIAHLIADRGIPASACLAITFTRRAASEMRERLAALVPEASESIAIHTFHSLGAAILREQAALAGLGPAFRIAGEEERLQVLAECTGTAERRARALLRRISLTKRSGEAPDPALAEAFRAYREALAARAWIDFDDLLCLTVDILAAHPALAAQYRERFRWISVDELQDVDLQQYRLLRLLAPTGTGLCAIGDPNQAIYGFRGADASCFERFARDYPDAVVVHLTRNYRSTGTIVRAASHVIVAGAPADEGATVVREMHERVTLHTAPTERAEAEHVVHAIERLIGGHSFFSIDSGRAAEPAASALSFGDVAVLYRTEGQAGALREALERSGIPFQQHGHDRLLDRAAVRAIVAALDDRAPGGGAGPSLAEALRAAAARAREGDPALERTALERALQQLTAIAEQCAGDRGRWADAIALATDADTWDPRADRVSLLTLHAAKGLEFPVVFLVGLEDGILPLTWGDEPPDPATLAEERRLLYVGMTRARDRLILSRAIRRHWRGRLVALPPSPFLSDIERELLEHTRTAALRREPDGTQLSLL